MRIPQKTPTPGRGRHSRPGTQRAELDALRALWLAKAKRLNLPTEPVGDRALRFVGALAVIYVAVRLVAFLVGLL